MARPQDVVPQYFNKALAATGIERFVLLTPGDKTGKPGIADDWEKEAQRSVGSQVQFFRASSLEDANQAFRT